MLLLASTAHLGYECMDGWTQGHTVEMYLCNVLTQAITFNVIVIFANSLSGLDARSWVRRPIGYVACEITPRVCEDRQVAIPSSVLPRASALRSAVIGIGPRVCLSLSRCRVISTKQTYDHAVFVTRYSPTTLVSAHQGSFGNLAGFQNFTDRCLPQVKSFQLYCMHCTCQLRMVLNSG